MCEREYEEFCSTCQSEFAVVATKATLSRITSEQMHSIELSDYKRDYRDPFYFILNGASHSESPKFHKNVSEEDFLRKAMWQLLSCHSYDSFGGPTKSSQITTRDGAEI